MIILGIHDGHNATAALMVEGQLRAAVSEERMTYRKNEMGFPKQAVDECLRIADIKPQDIDRVAFSTGSLPIQYLRIKREFSFSIRDWLNEQEEYWKPLLFDNHMNEDYLKTICKEKAVNNQVYSFENVPFILSAEQNVKYLNEARICVLSELYEIDAGKVVSFDHHKCHQHYAYFGSPFRGDKVLILTADGGGGWPKWNRCYCGE